MSEFDVVVIGGGPAGCYAALAAARKGLRVALFEEHGVIGWPRHDPGWLMESDFAQSIIGALGDRVPWSRVKEYRTSNPESGELLETSTLGGYQVRRDLLEREIAVSAVRAGASIYLRTKVTKLVRKDGRVEGVETNSTAVPGVKAQVFICADGIRSSNSGLALREGLCRRGELRAGVSYLLANAEVSTGVIEHFVSSDPLLDYRTFWSHRDGMCFFGAPSHQAFSELKARQDNVVSLKIKNAYPVEVSGYGRASAGKYGRYFERMVRDNVMFIGDASGGAGNIHGMIQGRFAATVAASAIREKDVTEKRLSEYQDLVVSTLGKAPFYWRSAREDFGSFDNWFRAVQQATRGIRATELGTEARAEKPSRQLPSKS